MPYYHVLLSFQDEPKTVRCLFADLAEKELRKQFVTPYRRGKNVLCGSEVIEVSRIKTVKIIRTADTSDQALERIEEKGIKHYEELNRGSRGVVFFRLDSRLEHIGEGGEEVTHAFILGRCRPAREMDQSTHHSLSPVEE